MNNPSAHATTPTSTTSLLAPIACPVRLDSTTAERLEREAAKASIHRSQCELDLSKTQSIDAEGLLALGRLLDSVRSVGKKLIFIGAQGSARHLLLACGLHHDALFFKNRQRAERWFSYSHDALELEAA